MPRARLSWGWLWLALLACLMAARPAAADPSFPKFTGLLVDAANVIPVPQRETLQQKLETFQARTGRQLVVATVPSLEGDDVADYGNRLFREWGIGLKGANNGVLLLVAPNERQMHIEVGYGLEPLLTDAMSGVIIRGTITPRFKAGDLPGGIDAGTDAIIQQLSLPDEEAKARQDAAITAWNKDHARRSEDGSGGAAIFWVIVVGVVLLSMLRGARRHGAYRGQSFGGSAGGSNWPIILWSIAEGLESGRRRGGGWGDGGGWGGLGGGGGGGGSDGGWTGGGFTGGGGGSSGGGGASGSW